jgi:hypothetical protein
MNKRIFVILLTAILLLISAFPVAAEANHTPFTGRCEIIKGGGDEMPNDPRNRYWQNKYGSVEHWRYQLWLLHCDWSDERLPEYLLTVDNWNMSWNDGRYIAVAHAKGYSSNVDGNITELWQATSREFLDWEWNYRAEVTMNGGGIYQGLLAKVTWRNVPDEEYYQIEGVLIEPGN